MQTLTKEVLNNPLHDEIKERIPDLIEEVFHGDHSVIPLTYIIDSLLEYFIDKTIDETREGKHTSFQNYTGEDYDQFIEEGTIGNVFDDIYLNYGETTVMHYAVYEVLADRSDLESYLEPLFVMDCMNALNAMSIFYNADGINTSTICNSPLQGAW